MEAKTILIAFLVLRFVQHLIERSLASANRKYYEDPTRRAEAQKALGISDEDMAKTLAYSRDRSDFARISSWITIVLTLGFLGLGGLGLLERWASAIATGLGGGGLLTGLLFFALLGVLSLVTGLPFELYHTFVIEERHGFNRQTLKGFVTDKLKALVLGVILGGLVLSLLLLIMQSMGDRWWVWAWLAVFTVSLLTAWLYPTFLAPLFNKFSPIETGDLRDRIFELARRVDFQTDGIFIMDASRRSSHGNAYFTGVFGKKRIVLFDNLVKSMSPSEVVAVLAHELGHFKLHHIRWALIRGFLTTGMMFYLLSLALPLTVFYQSFGLAEVSNYGALIVFSLWFGPISFLMQPLENYLSRRNEFSADAFALRHIDDAKELGRALLKLREHSNVMPISHPIFSTVYHSHPPLLERLRAMRYI